MSAIGTRRPRHVANVPRFVERETGRSALYRSEEVTRYMDIEPCACLDEAREIIRFHVEDTGCRWGLFDRGSGELIGALGYHRWERERASAEIGFDLGRALWGRGLMREATEAAIRFGFESMGLERIEAEVEPLSVRSIGLLERLGFRPDLPGRAGGIWFHLVPPVRT